MTIDVNTASMKELLDFYNAHCGPVDLGPVKRFADLPSAQRRVKKLLELMGPKKVAPATPKPQRQPRLPGEAISPEERARRSAAVTSTWQNPQVRAVRSARHCVRVDGQEFRSVREAFLELGLPLKRHVPFRAKLKQQGSLQEFGRSWTAVKTN